VNLVSDRVSNPLDLSPPCDRFVPGYGAVDAAFHVVGDHPGVHGGLETGIPFTGRPWSTRLFGTLEAAGLVREWDPEGPTVTVADAFFSYVHTCEPDERPPSAASYARLEPFFDAELRAITADVLVPVGARATAHVLEQYTARARRTPVDMAALHASELRGAGWLVLPCRDPAEWDAGDGAALADALTAIRSRDFRQTADLGRFFVGDDPYLVR
jgi:uracil-DNA glycosylase family 4